MTDRGWRSVTVLAGVNALVSVALHNWVAVLAWLSTMQAVHALLSQREKYRAVNDGE